MRIIATGQLSGLMDVLEDCKTMTDYRGLEVLQNASLDAALYIPPTSRWQEHENELEVKAFTKTAVLHTGSISGGSYQVPLLEGGFKDQLTSLHPAQALKTFSPVHA